MHVISLLIDAGATMVKGVVLPSIAALAKRPGNP